MLRGLMMDRPLLVSSAIDYAAEVYPGVEIVAPTVEGGQAATLALVDEFNLNRVGWNGYNVLHTVAARTGGLMLGYAQPGCHERIRMRQQPACDGLLPQQLGPGRLAQAVFVRTFTRQVQGNAVDRRACGLGRGHARGRLDGHRG